MINEYNKNLAEVFKALGHPVRLTIARGLCQNKCNVNKIVGRLGLPQPTISQHLRILKAAGIITGERKGVEICYRVTDPFVKQVLDKYKGGS
ncbi:MAG: winged helix-turn-helix transcriptional regulator [Candidatus Saganbacteria bacterium]|nr:winged helix-turn-helix transcriptional regulator [Candidatus Saganbacteria bacterium]